MTMVFYINSISKNFGKNCKTQQKLVLHISCQPMLGAVAAQDKPHRIRVDRTF